MAFVDDDRGFGCANWSVGMSCLASLLRASHFDAHFSAESDPLDFTIGSLQYLAFWDPNPSMESQDHLSTALTDSNCAASIIAVEHQDSSDLRKRLLLIYCAAGNASAAVVCAAQCRHACIKGSCNLVSTAPATRTITRLSQVCADGSPLLTRQVLVSCCGGCGAPVGGSACQLLWGLWCPCLW